jgi:hypothetical protein
MREKQNNIGKFIHTKVEQNGLVGAAGYYYVLAVPHQPINEVVGSERFRF